VPTDRGSSAGFAQLDRADVIPDWRAGEQLVRVAVGPLILDDLFDDCGSERFEASDRADTVRRGDSLAI
jgi:hypothetical protein